jgi:hypothetical protein
MRGYAGGAAALGRRVHGDRRRLCPTADGDMAVAHVDRDDEVLAERSGEARERSVFDEGGGSDDDTRRARAQQSLGIGDRADASGRLHVSRRRREHGAAHDVGADLSTSRAVEVDEVDQLRACVAVALDERERIGVAVRDLTVVPLAQPNSVVAEEIDCRNHGPASYPIARYCVLSRYHATMLIQHRHGTST